MPDVLNNVAIDRLARWILGLTGAAPALQVRLFQTPVTVTAATVEADLTEVTAPGYSPVALLPGSWAGGTSAGIALYSYPAVPVIFTGPGSPAQTVYGHWVRDTLTGQVLWALTWPIPFAIPAPGGTVYLEPTWQDRQC